MLNLKKKSKTILNNRKMTSNAVSARINNACFTECLFQSKYFGHGMDFYFFPKNRNLFLGADI